jgi:hypothetical protein
MNQMKLDPQIRDLLREEWKRDECGWKLLALAYELTEADPSRLADFFMQAFGIDSFHSRFVSNWSPALSQEQKELVGQGLAEGIRLAFGKEDEDATFAARDES